MEFGKRNYRYKGVDSGQEQKNFWLWILIALAIGIGIVYFF
jgi:hypothetical protein